MIKTVLILFSLISFSFAEVKYPTQQEFIDKIRNQEFDHLRIEHGYLYFGVLKDRADTLYAEGHYSLENILVKDLIEKSNTRLVIVEDDSANYYWMQELFFIVLALLFSALLGMVIYKQNQILKLLRANQ